MEEIKIFTKRLSHIDIAKAIAIILVIIGHVRPDTHEIIPYKSLIYAFHMPLFFIISGMFVCTNRNNYSTNTWKNFIEKNFQNLILPFIIFGLIYMTFSYHNFGILFYASRPALTKIGTLTSLWFLPVLFLARTYLEGLFCLTAKLKINVNKIIPIFILVFILTGLLLPHHNLDNEFGNFWNYDVAFVAAGFMLIGTVIKPLIEYLSTKKLLSAILFVIFSLLFWHGFNMTDFRHEFVLMCQGSYYNPFLFVLNSLSGSFAILTFSIIADCFVKGNKIIKFIGMNTMGIYLLHKNMLPEIILFLQNHGLNWNVTGILMAIVVSGIALFFSYILVVIIKKYIPEIIGSRQI